MRHITLPSFDAPPCNGEIHFIPLSPKDEAPSPHRSLPILGQRIVADGPPSGEWVCGRCGQKWSREPLPQDAL